MFETLLHLPLFQGFSVEQLTQLIETVGMDFQKYEAGDLIIKEGQECTHARFLVSGSVRLSSPYYGRTMTIHETLTAPNIILPGFLYGWSTSSPSTIVAEEEVGILQFSKATFETLLATYPIFLINFLNIISYRAQYTGLMLQRPPQNLEQRFFDLLSLTLQRGSTHIVIETPRANLADAIGVPKLALYTLLNDLNRDKKINLGRGRIEIL